MFLERLKECRDLKQVTQKVAAAELGISERAYQHYELGTREPNITMLVAIAVYFDVSLDYLMGRSTIRDSHKKQ